MKKFLIFTLLVCNVAVYAQVRFASVYTDNMVVQQRATVEVWGTATAGENIRIVASWAPNDTLKTKSDPWGRWRATFKTPAADHRSHTIEANRTKIENVALGEVWLCSGQSNMEWNANRGIKDGEKEVAAANYPDIRIMQVPLLAAPWPQYSVDATWTLCTPESMRTASAVGYFFARNLHKELGVPVGIISSAWGGTVAEVWTPEKDITRNQKLAGKLSNNESQWHTGAPGAMYNQMIFPLTPFTLSGVIWYQGESNCDFQTAHPEVYEEVMATMIGAWRREFGREFPFYFVQIAPFTYGEENGNAALLRNEQAKVVDRVPKTGMVVVSDLVNDVRNIHPLNKQDVGARLAAYALAEVYNRDVTNYKSPVLDGVSFEKGRAAISFKNAQSGITMRGSEVVGLNIAGADGVYYPAKIKIDGDQVIAWAKEVKTPTSISYCYDNATIGNLFSGAGLPVAPFKF